MLTVDLISDSIEELLDPVVHVVVLQSRIVLSTQNVTV
jgi:hypothetical protein